MLELYIEATTKEVKASIRLFTSVKGGNGEEAVPKPKVAAPEPGSVSHPKNLT